MSLEQKIEALTAAIEANTAALKAGGGAASTSTGKASTTKAPKEEKVAKSTHTREETAALVRKVKADKGVDAAKAVIKKFGGVDKLDDIPEDKLDAVFDGATEALEEDDGV